MVTKSIKFQNITITYRMALNGCYINGKFFKPNGTGPEKIAGQKWLGTAARWLLQKIPSEVFQKPASLYHDIMCKMGGNKEDFKTCNSIMRKISVAEVRSHFSFFNPLRYVATAMMWRNWFSVSGSIGREAFEFKTEIEIQNLEVKTINDFEIDAHLDLLENTGRLHMN